MKKHRGNSVPRKELPKEFLAEIEKRIGKDVKKFSSALSLETPIVSVRKNPKKLTEKHDWKSTKKVPWTVLGNYIEHKVNFAQDPLWHGGSYYVQEASSMFVGHVFSELTKQDFHPLLILDACAAPGGKSTDLLSHIEEDSFLLSNEVISTRKGILEENICKWGHTNASICSHSIEALTGLGGIFDLVLIDAPCSGEGLFRRIPSYRDEWSTDLVNLCQLRQKKILGGAEKLIRNGGYLIYSTCTYNDDENINNVHWIKEQGNLQSIAIDFPEEWQIAVVEKDGIIGYQFYPHRLKGEGFFLAVLHKEKDSSTSDKRFFSKTKKSNSKKGAAKALQEYKGDLPPIIRKLPDNLRLFINEYQELFALNSQGQLLQTFFDKKERLKLQHFNLGQFKGKDFIPSHFLAMSGKYNPEVPKITVDRTQALQFLAKAPIDAKGSAKGWVLVQYEGMALGWIKNLGNRINNYYPKPYRLRKIIPESE